MEQPTKSRRGKAAPAIFANPNADAIAPTPAVELPAPVAAMTAAVPPADTVVTPSIPAIAEPAPAADAGATQSDETTSTETDSGENATGEAAAADAPAPIAAATVAASEQLAERNRETVTAQSNDIVSTFLKGSFPMATAANAFDTGKAQEMMGDIATRTKGAMEKSVKIAEEMTEFTKGNVEAIVTSGRVAAKGIEAMAQDAAETAKAGFEQAQTAIKSLTQVKSPSEFFQLQSDYAKTAFDQLVANASKASEQMMKLAGDVVQPLSNRYALASEKVKSAAF